MRQAYWVKPVEDIFESMSHGEKLTKFVACDRSEEPGDFQVEIHGFVNSQGELIITHEKVDPVVSIKSPLSSEGAVKEGGGG